MCLYRRWQLAVHRFAMAMTGSADAADDVTQDTFLILMREGGRYDARKGSVPAYLHGVARHLVFRRLRRESRYRALADADLESRPGGEDPGQALLRWDQARGVQRALLGLSPRLREVLVMCHVQELSYAEAAERLGVPIGTVRSRLSRAREALVRGIERSELQLPAGGRALARTAS